MPNVARSVLQQPVNNSVRGAPRGFFGVLIFAVFRCLCFLRGHIANVMKFYPWLFILTGLVLTGCSSPQPMMMSRLTTEPSSLIDDSQPPPPLTSSLFPADQ